MKTVHDLISADVQSFVTYLMEEDIHRFHFVTDKETGKVIPSHIQLQPIADLIENDTRDFMQHEGAFFQVNQQFSTLQGAFVHRTCRGQAAGGIRYWSYDSVEDYIRDGLRLSKGMTRKNALAGLWWGGGKGVMAHNPDYDKNDPAVRAELYRDYGRLMTAIRGCYVTAEDVGTSVDDMANIFKETRFTTCIPEELGGSGNPSIPTARGVVCGMEAALDFCGMGTLEGKVVAVQGMGHVGSPLIRFLFEKNVGKIIACDINPENVEALKQEFAERHFETTAVPRGDTSILSEECDVVAPCATGAILNPQTIPGIKAKIVCGAANNQLEDAERDDVLLQKHGVVYVPDFLNNRMGIVNCADEQFGYVANDPMFEKHLSREWKHSIYQTTLTVLQKSKETGESPGLVAMKLADELSLQPHPIFGHRGQQIIDSLVADKWYEQN